MLKELLPWLKLELLLAVNFNFSFTIGPTCLGAAGIWRYTRNAMKNAPFIVTSCAVNVTNKLFSLM